ncbi:EamA family transporter [uncultured Demequina sp.]|uniref:EamA family transporter n=1 Tax=uncultured Demequina sp. TaxID=693499 RepID=UPI0025CCF203|nr:EamA family transporter [uncultured Demequina sp.]
MPRATPLQPSLNAGEFGPRMVARTDFGKYPLGCATLENMIPLPQGGAMRRPGTMFVAEARDHDAKPRLIPFQFSTHQAYVLEAGNGYFRFFKDRGRIDAAATDAVVANGDFAADIAGWDDRSAGGGAIAHDAAAGMLSLAAAGGGNAAHAEQAVATTATGQEHVLRFRIAGAPGDTVTLRIGSTSEGTEVVDDVEFGTGWHVFAFTPDTSPFYLQFRYEAQKTIRIDDVSLIDAAAVEVGMPYGTADLPSLKVAQSADTMWICHETHPVHKLTRSGHSSWSLTEMLFHDGPWFAVNATATTLSPSAASGTGITITASGTEGINGGAGFADADIGRLVRIEYGSDWGHALITAVASPTSVTADVSTAFGGTTASSQWRLGAWSGTTGYPRAVAFFEQRLAFAGSTDRPQTFWLSQSADFENMRPDDGAGSVEDDDALDYTISADQVNAIRWMAPGQKLFIGTVGGEWLVQSDGPLLTPTDIDVKRQTAYGTADVAPQQMRGRMLFLQRAARKVLEFAFALEIDNYQALDMTLLADHISRGGFTEMTYRQELDSTLWCVRADGELCSLSYQPDQDVIGWSRHILGGAFDGGNAAAESVAVIPGVDEDELWIVAKRTIGGETRRFVEVFASAYQTGDDQAHAFYVDSGLVYDAPVTITGATRSDPVTVTAPSHGFADGEQVLISGAKGMTEINDGVFAVAGAQLCYFFAVGYLDVSVALLIEYMAPVAVVLWMWLRHGSRPTRLTVAGALIAAAGLVLLLDVLHGGTDVDLVGVLWALGAMVGASVYFVIGGDESNGLPPLTLAAGGLVVALVVLGTAGATGILPMAWSTDTVQFVPFAAPWWAVALVLGVVTAATAYVAGIAATRRLGARLGSFVALIEVMAAALFAWFLLGQAPGPLQIGGALLVVAGVVVVKLGERPAPTVAESLAEPPAATDPPAPVAV